MAEIVVITGWIAAILLFGNFLTCFAMPWATKCPTPNKCKPDECEHRKPFCTHHKPFALLSIIAVIIHVVLSILL